MPRPRVSLANPFEACWLRIDRSETHRAAAADAWSSFLDDEPFEVELDHGGGGEFALRVIQVCPTPQAMSVLIGEWLYNLRCALDYAIYATAVCVSGKDPPPGQGQLQFPAYDTEVQYHQNEYRLKPLAAHQRSMIEIMQPYRHENPDTSALGWLNRLARIDRHRRLTVMTAFVAEMAPIVEVPAGCQARLDVGERMIIEKQAEIARFTVTPWQDGLEVSANPQAGIDPEILEWSISPFWRPIGYNIRLQMLRQVVEVMVTTLEYDCIGSSRKADFLTEAFKSECDARRVPPS